MQLSAGWASVVIYMQYWCWAFYVCAIKPRSVYVVFLPIQMLRHDVLGKVGRQELHKLRQSILYLINGRNGTTKDVMLSRDLFSLLLLPQLFATTIQTEIYSKPIFKFTTKQNCFLLHFLRQPITDIRFHWQLYSARLVSFQPNTTILVYVLFKAHWIWSVHIFAPLGHSNDGRNGSTWTLLLNFYSIPSMRRRSGSKVPSLASSDAVQ
jgi:hypothetical protein